MPQDHDLYDAAWFNSRWRPAMGWQYLAVCIFDFIIAPVMMGIYSTYTGQFHPWEPLTLKGSGLYHLAMAGVVGVTAWTRSKEKMLMMENISPTDAAKSTDDSSK